MSKELLQEAAVIRAEQAEGANTAQRVGSLLERMIGEHDRLRQRLPDPVVSPRVILVSELDTMNTVDYATSGPQMPGAYYIVTRIDPIRHRVLVVGTLTVFSDSMMHALTQIYYTHEVPTKDGTGFDGTHRHDTVQVWTRSFGLRSQSYAGPESELYFPVGGWGKWHKLSAASPLPPSGGSADLTELRDEVTQLRRKVADLSKLLTL